MPKISFVIPVYNGEKTLRKCVESIIFGQEQDIELILIEDRSKDNSWNLCKQLADEFPQVKCLRNEVNRGVSFTRNQGLNAATGKYVLFVDSDDWVSGSYAKAFMDTCEAHPDKMVLCGYLFLDYISDSRRMYGIENQDIPLRTINKANFLDLADEILLQQLWNKLFVLQTIREKKILFDESISMGEDFQFVIDYIKATSCTECVIINRPLYYYTRRNKNSLMSQWADISNLDKSVHRIEQMLEICGADAAAAAQNQIAAIKNQFAYSIVRNQKLRKPEKLDKIRSIIQRIDAQRYYDQSRKNLLRENLIGLRNQAIILWKRIYGKIRSVQNHRRIKNTNRQLLTKEITLISQNCIGGVFYHDMGLSFCSPTINSFIPHPDFIRFVKNLKHYMNTPLRMSWGEEYPIGRLDDVQIHFVHYETCLEAAAAWQRRKQRILYDRLVVLSTDRDGFNDTVFEEWKTLDLPKVLFTANPKYREDAQTVYFPEYRKNGCIPDIIPDRKFYKNGKLLSCVNQASTKQL